MVNEMRILVFTVLLLFLSPTFSGDWQANLEIRHRLTIPEEVPSPATASEDKWVSSLVRNLRKSGAEPNYVHRFARSKAKYYINNKIQDNLIFIYRKNKNKYLIINKTQPYYGKFIIDFKEKKIYASGVSSVSVPPSRSFGAIVRKTKHGLYGIPVNQDIGNVDFAGKTVTWY